jgi:hypothetical protein
MKNRLNSVARRTQAADGTWHPSDKQAKRWNALCLLQRVGVISNLAREVPVILQGKDGPLRTPTGRPMMWRADAVYDEKGVTIYEDSKGVITEKYAMKRAVLAAQGVIVRET